MKAKVKKISSITEDIVHIRVLEGKYRPYEQIPYKQETGDEISSGKQGKKFLIRNGKRVGVIVEHGKKLTRFDDITGEKFEEKEAEKIDNFTIEDNYNAVRYNPEAVYIKTKPVNVSVMNNKYQFQYDLFLKLPYKMHKEYNYTISLKGLNVKKTCHNFLYDPENTRSVAVHANQIGYHPQDPVKRAYLSIWLGTGGSFSFSERKFQVIEVDKNEKVYEGKIEISKKVSEPENFNVKKNHNKTDVYKMDFSELKKTGNFKIYVEGIGCSFSFPINEQIWENAFEISMKGILHNRNGIELGPPYTDYERPRPYHQEEGLIVYHSETPLMDSGNGLNALGTDENNFGNLVKGRTNKVVPNAWGGYFDAADWDRRIQHLRASRLHLELLELNCNYFSGKDLSLPESDNHLPDVLNEALWNINCYKRLQTEEGGVRGGIEAEEHPCAGETSWQESLTVMSYKPGIWSSYEYAGLASRASYQLQDLDENLSREYRESALKAFKWAEERYPDWKTRDDVLDRAKKSVYNSRNLAAVELFRLTGNEKWHDIFKNTEENQKDALFVYAVLGGDNLDDKIKEKAKKLFIEEGNKALENSKGNAFNVTMPNIERPISTWGHFFSVPNVVSVVRAHYLTKKDKFLRAIIKACHFGSGANPLNLCYTSGLGKNFPVNFMHIDTRRRGEKPPAGITIYGNYDMLEYPEHWFSKSFIEGERYVKPDIEQWPVTEMYFDIYSDAASNEWTVHQTLGPVSYVWGYLASLR